MILHTSLLWRHNGRDCVSNHQPHECLLNRLFRRRSKKTSKLRVTGLCAGNSPGTGEFPAQMASNAENVSIWWRHHDFSFISPLMTIKKSVFTCRLTHSLCSSDGVTHYSDVIMSVIPCHITGTSIVCSTVRSKKSSKLRVTGLVLGESTGYRWIPVTKDQ